MPSLEAAFTPILTSALDILPTLRLVGLVGRGLVFGRPRPGHPFDLGAACRSVLERLKVEVEVRGTFPDQVPFWIANHISWLDPIILLGQRPATVLAKVEVQSYPFIRPWIQQARLRFVRRECPHSRASALYALAKEMTRGGRVLVFPEGTTTPGDRLAPLHEGSLRLAYRRHLPLAPIRMDGLEAHYPWIGEDPLLPHVLELLRAGRTRVRVAPGPVLHPEHFPSEQIWIDEIRQQLDRPTRCA